MSIDENTYIEGALVGIEEQIYELTYQANEMWEAYKERPTFLEYMEKLEHRVRELSESVEIFQNYTGRYDHVSRHCWGDHPGGYEVQCKVCDVQRLCAEETIKRDVRNDIMPTCFRRNPLYSEPRCWHCMVFGVCLDETRKREAEKAGTNPERAKGETEETQPERKPPSEPA